MNQRPNPYKNRARYKFRDRHRTAAEFESAKLSSAEVIAIFNKYLTMANSDAQSLDFRSMPLIDVWVLKSIEKGIKDGDFYTLDKMLDRCFGRSINAVQNLFDKLNAPEIVITNLDLVPLEEKIDEKID